jgi:HPt (histidine-containing phosphotransfer) domain-containing protein
MNMPDPTHPSLDAQALARLRELDPDGRLGVVNRVLTVFESSLHRMVSQLEAQRQGADSTVVAHIAHTLKSSSGSVGAIALSKACAEVESRLRKGDTSALHLDISRLISEGQSALAAVAAILRP